jgi:hypothetical protein
MWGWIPQFGHTVFFWSTLVAAVFGGIGIGAAFISAMVGYELSEWASRDANERISNAERSAKVEIEKARSDADAKIGIAQADIAQSRKETEEAKARALEAQLALERYKQPRNLDIDSFLQRLKGVPSRKSPSALCERVQRLFMGRAIYWLFLEHRKLGINLGAH